MSARPLVNLVLFLTRLAPLFLPLDVKTGRKSVRPCDVADFVFAAPEMYWLRDEFREERRFVVFLVVFRKRNPKEGSKRVI